MTQRLTRMQLHMGTAELVAKRSTCDRMWVGAVIVRDDRAVMSGYNGTPSGMAHCKHICTCNGTGCPPRVVPIDGHLEDCPYILPCSQAVHAEANAIAWAARKGIAIEHGHIFVTMAPCLACAQLIIASGLRDVTYLQDYRVRDGLNLLNTSGVRVSQMGRL